MKRVVSAVCLGAAVAAASLIGVPAGAALVAPEDFAPISIYSLDDGSLADSIADPALVTPAGEAFGGPVPTADRFGNPTGALLFDGVDDYVQTAEDSNISPLTFSVWFRADDISGEHSIVDSDVSGKYGHSLIIGYDDPNKADDTPRDGSLDVQYHNGFWDTGYKITAGTWTHAFVTYGDGQMRLYVGTWDEQTQTTGPITKVAEQPYTPAGTPDGSKFRFGRHNQGDPQWFKGAMDDIRFYNQALPIDVITSIGSSTPPPPPPGNTKPPLGSAGDVHIRTPDGLVYDFQTFGEFLLAEAGPDVIVQARQEPWDSNPAVSINTAAALQVGPDKLEFSVKPERSYHLNDQATDLPSTDGSLPGGGTVYVSRADQSVTDLTIVWPDGQTGARVILFGTTNIDIGVARLSGSLTFQGVLGNLDGDPSNDMQIRGGETVPQPATPEQFEAFGDSWRVPAADSLFREPVTVDVPEDATQQLTLADLEADAVTDARATCEAGGVTDTLVLDNCSYDVAATGDDSFVVGAALQQEAVDLLPSDQAVVVAALETSGTMTTMAQTEASTESSIAPTTEPSAALSNSPAAPTTSAVATADTDDSSGGLGTGLWIGLIALVLVIIIVVVVVVRRRGNST